MLSAAQLSISGLRGWADRKSVPSRRRISATTSAPFMGCPCRDWEGRAESIGETQEGETALTCGLASSSWGGLQRETGCRNVFLRDGELHGGGGRRKHRRRHLVEGRQAARAHHTADRRIPHA